MRFDDRLSTVLALAAVGLHERAVQWRQLVELVARGAGRSRPELREHALQRIAGLMREVPEDIRAAAARSIAGPDVPAELVALFASDSLEIAAPLVTAAELDEAGWAAVRAVSSPSVTAMLAALRPERAAPATSDVALQPAPATPLPVAVTTELPGEVQEPFPTLSAPQREPQRDPLPSGVFHWECGPTGEIDWVDGAPRAATIGLSLADRLDQQFRARLPFEEEPVRLAEEGPLAGEWRWSGTPMFLPGAGRFAGYRGIARREGRSNVEAATAPISPDSDSLRELMHELRTPLNAIIGFGEIIGGQYLGPAHRAYRDRATDIVRQARLLLDAVQDLDLAARIRSPRSGAGAEGSLDDTLRTLRLALLEQAVTRDVTLTIAVRGTLPDLAIPFELHERLIPRFLSSVLDSASAGERIELVVDRIGSQVAIAIDRPHSVQGLAEDELLHPSPDATGEIFNLGFTLRLVRGLANLVGGSLDVAPNRLVLLLPVAGE
ncbi:histidine kinase dimerization/phospho-acceptor domain-containing protein [Sphingomonas arenae]|uniref:histidine kinase dimerization/phospho-acceptor domain-containing protein n=1 Tax=Sphingomonas arenae TaxID=2812555 RepID=UPI0019689590|nr:histidine kinase dimerization/phospho-acceptor domain-containing protein [Sphingomonas arenae]